MSNAASAPATGSLLQRCRELLIKIKAVASLEKDKGLLEQFEEVQQALQLHRERSSHLLGVVRVMQGQGLVKNSDLPTAVQVAGFQKKIGALQKRLVETRTKLKVGNDWAGFDKETSALIKQLEDRLKSIWSEFVTDHIRNTDGFRPFRQIEGCAAILADLDVLSRQLTDFLSGLPKTDADLTAVKKASDQIDALIAKINLGEVPPAVQEFLKKATQGGISLTELTDEILKYLRARNFVSSLRVTSGSSYGR